MCVTSSLLLRRAHLLYHRGLPSCLPKERGHLYPLNSLPQHTGENTNVLSHHFFFFQDANITPEKRLLSDITVVALTAVTSWFKGQLLHRQ